MYSMSYFPLGTRRTGIMSHQSRPHKYPSGYNIKCHINKFIILLLSLLICFLQIGLIHFIKLNSLLLMSSVHWCKDNSIIDWKIHSSPIWTSHFHSHLFITPQVFFKPAKWPASTWPLGSVGRALHWYRSWIQPSYRPKFFQALFSLLL